MKRPLREGGEKRVKYRVKYKKKSVKYSISDSEGGGKKVLNTQLSTAQRPLTDGVLVAATESGRLTEREHVTDRRLCLPVEAPGLDGDGSAVDYQALHITRRFLKPCQMIDYYNV